MFQKTVLNNQIRVITESIPEYRSIAMGFLLDAGPRNEPIGKYGIAHLVEHMIFQGTYTRNANQIAKFMDESGGYTGAFTTRDYTCYTATVLDDYRTYALELIGDILLDSAFPSDRLEKEKRAVRREIDAAHDVPDQRVEDNLKHFIWGDHPLGRLIAGYPETISSIERQDLIEFVSTNYKADHLIIAAAGHVHHPDFVGQVEDAFWKMPSKSTADHPFHETRPADFLSGLTIEYAQVSQSYFCLGIRAPSYADDCRYEMHLVNSILGGGISSRLFCSLRDNFGLVYDIGSEYQAYSDDGIFVIKGSTAPELLTQAIELTLLEIGRFISGEEPVEDDELWKTKMNLRGQHMISSESTHTRMSRLITQELYFGSHISTNDIMKRIDHISISDVKTLCRQKLVPALKSISLSIVTPNSETDQQMALQSLLENFKANYAASPEN